MSRLISEMPGLQQLITQANQQSEQQAQQQAQQAVVQDRSAIAARNQGARRRKDFRSMGLLMHAMNLAAELEDEGRVRSTIVRGDLGGVGGGNPTERPWRQSGEKKTLLGY